MTKVPEAGFEIIGLNIAGLQRRLTLENLLFPLKVVSSFLASLKIIKSFKPDVVVGFGGYASSPITLAAARKKVPVVLQEQNSYAGLANKSVARKASKICVAYEGMDKFFPAEKIVLTGNPVRSNIKNLKQKHNDGLAHFDLDPKRKTILVVGGSLGARTINESVIQNLNQIKDSPYQVIWQCGSFYYKDMKSRMAGNSATNIHLVEFIREMDMAYAAADIIISRAGALTISELCIVGKPVVFVPSPNVAEDHQTKNAQALVSQGAGELVPDNMSVEKLIDTAFAVLKDDNRAREMAERIASLGKPHATEDITEQVVSLIK